MRRRAGKARKRSPGTARIAVIAPPTAIVSSLRNPRLGGTGSMGFSAVSLFGPLLVFLAADAQGGLGPGFEPFHGDRLAALLADAEGAVVDLGERQVDLLEKSF